jgi:MFS family permease
MIRRFCLYGFLKNQRYFEPFIILAFLEKGLTFLDIGLLIGFRELCILVLEIPSGAVADVFGRRRSMIFSFISYIVSFVLFALSSSMVPLMVAMFFFAVGDAFRTGTHKAMIFEWLRLENRLDERTRVYGFTRSWSKFGSAISSLVAGALVMISGTFTVIFWLSVVPYVFNLVNFLGYPKSLEGDANAEVSWAEAYRLTGRALRESVTRPRLRGLFLESMMLEGVFKVTGGYLQPVLKSLALGLPLLAVGLAPDQRSAMIIGLVYFIYFLMMGFASQRAHQWATRLGGEEQLTRLMWVWNLLIFMFMGIVIMMGMKALVVVAFIALGMVQNTFRPAQISRFNKESSPEMGATILSMESQSKSLAAAIMAPLLGWTVDKGVSGAETDVTGFWPVAALGAVLSAVVVVYRLMKGKSSIQDFPNPRQK